MDPRLNSLTIEKLLRSLLDFFLPRVCLACGRQLLESERHLCSSCAADLPLTFFESRTRNPMADRLNGRLLDEEVAGYLYATALFYYEEGYANITQALKYRRNFAAGRFFARLLAESIAGAAHFSDVDLVTCVPLHWMRRRSRGYNQAEIVACEVWRGLPGARFEPRLLRRVRRTRSQAQLSEESKELNVKGAFALNKAVRLEGVHHILICDDVFTTGSTLAACCRVLLQALGPGVRISVATLAYAGA